MWQCTRIYTILFQRRGSSELHSASKIPVTVNRWPVTLTLTFLVTAMMPIASHTYTFQILPLELQSSRPAFSDSLWEHVSPVSIYSRASLQHTHGMFSHVLKQRLHAGKIQAAASSVQPMALFQLTSIWSHKNQARILSTPVLHPTPRCLPDHWLSLELCHTLRGCHLHVEVSAVWLLLGTRWQNLNL